MQQRSTPRVADIIMEIFVEALNVLNQKIYYSWNLIIQDPDDNKFFDVAVAANADFLVTNDAHFNVVKPLKFPSVKIIDADDFLDLVIRL